MDDNFNSVVIEPKQMEIAKRLHLAKKVYNDAHRFVFNGINFHEFFHTVFLPDTIQTKIILYKHHEEIIGYSTFQVYEIKKSQLQFYIVMSEMCLKESAYQHRIHPIDFFVKESAKFIFQNPLAKVFLIDTLVSPLIYKKVCHTAFEIYPVYNKNFPKKLIKICGIVAKKFHWKIYSAGKYIVRKLKWKVKQQYFLQDNSNDPNKKYYSSLVPDFSTGKGLVIVIPITFANVIASILKSAFYRVARYSIHTWKSTIISRFTRELS